MPKSNNISPGSTSPQVHLRRQWIITLCMLSTFALSSWFTTKGLFDKAIEAGVANMEGMITAAMSAAVAATSLGVATILLMSVAAGALKKQRFAVLLLVLTLIPFTAGISTFNAILGNAGPASLVYDMREAADAYKFYYQSTDLTVSGAQTAKAALEPLEASICALAKGEKTGGAISGSGGKGAVYAAYLSGCTSIHQINETLIDTVARSDKRRGRASQILTDLQNIPNDTSFSVFERQAAFRIKTGDLQTLITASRAENVSKRLTAQLDILQASVATLDVKTGGYGKTQSSAIESLKAALGLVSKTIRKLTETSSETASPPPRLLEMGEAVVAHWERNIPQILLAILIDGLVLWFAALLMVSRNSLQDD